MFHEKYGMRPAVAAELPALSALCLRSKGHWGYDRDFLDACRDELTVTPADLARDRIAVAEATAGVVGMAQIHLRGDICELLKLFVAPEAIGQGHGRALFAWVREQAQAQGARRIVVESDPQAEPFYRHLGMRRVGRVPSGSIPGRFLPMLAMEL